MKKKIDLTNIDVEKAKKESLCALPWMHIHLTPDHHILPCCIANTENSQDVVGKQTNVYITSLSTSSEQKKKATRSVIKFHVKLSLVI